MNLSIIKLHVISCGLLANFITTSAIADASIDLQQRLNKVNSFHATFSQKVTDVSGSSLQNGKGELWVKRPNQFHWHITAPDESVIVSDGQNLWFYNPFIEQVSVSLLKNTSSNTPFVLITRNRLSDWQYYNVKKQGDNFELTPKSSYGNLKQFTITVTPSGTIYQFGIIEQDGQRISYQLQIQKNSVISSDKFTFTPPEGVKIDDQRP